MTNDQRLSAPPKVNVGMGIHRTCGEVFDAFVDPDTTKRFWIADSSGRLAHDATVTWDMNAAGAQATVAVRVYEPAKHLVFDWGDSNETATVDLRFSAWQGDGCYVAITETGFDGDADTLAARAADSTGGFTMVLCSLKALLEHDIELNAVTDCQP